MREPLDAGSFYTALGERIRQAREHHRLTQDDVATYVGLKRASIANIEAGRQRTQVHTGVQIAKALGTDLPTLMDLSRELEPHMLDPSPIPSRHKPAMRDDLHTLARVGRMYLDALDADPEHELLTGVEALMVTEVRGAVERWEPK